MKKDATGNQSAVTAVFILLAALTALNGWAQQTSAVVPPLVRFSGNLADLSGKPITGTVGVTFSLYTDEQGGVPLWLETQNVVTDHNGHYSIQLGSTKPDGLRTDLFSSGEARWLGVQPEGQEEKARVLLLSVPYALKAGDAQTLGGLPASAFALVNSPTETARGGSTISASTSTKASPPPANPTVTGKGTLNYIPMWDTASDIVNSAIFQKGTAIGIGTTSPAATLDVNGKGDVRGTLTLFPKGTDPALAVSGTPFKVDQTGKVTFISGQTFPGTGTITGITTGSGSGLSGGGISGTLSLKVAPAGIANAMLQNSKITLNATTAGGLSTPGAMTLGSTYTIGLKPCSANQLLQYSGTVWNCSSAGTGTITGITTASGSGLSGGGTGGTLNLTLTKACAANQVLQWNGSAWACSNAGGSVTSVGSGLGLTGGPITASGTLSLDTTAVPLLAAYNTFSAGQVVLANGNVDGLDSIASGVSYNGILGFASANTGTGNGVFGIAVSAGGYGVAGSNAASGGTGVYGYGTTGVSGLSTICCGAGGDFFGFSAAAGSGEAGTNAVVGNGGNSDTACCFNGGIGVLGYGGTGTNYSGAGVQGTGGSSDVAGPGIVGFGGQGAIQDSAGGAFSGGKESIDGDGIDAYAGTGFAGIFNGNLWVTGYIAAGTKDFRIDHPLDPANKYLVHASVESSEMMNIYTGNVTTDDRGEATVQLPDWFEVLNADFRYQLTVIGQFAQAIVGRKIENNQFEIRTNAPNVEVSWQITGVRQDAYAKAHPLVVEEEKEDRLRGFYIHPELNGAPEEKQIEWARHPQMMKRMKEHPVPPPPAIKHAPQLRTIPRPK